MSVYWIEVPNVRLGIMPRPRGHDWLADDLRMLRQTGAEVIVSALTASEIEDLGLNAEAEESTEQGLIFVSFPIEDRCTPTDQSQLDLLVDRLSKFLKNGKAIVVHCRAGIGRSSLIVASILAKMGLSPEVAFKAIEKARGCPVPDTAEQRQWVERYSDFQKSR